jgi:hypothetical protein
VVVAAAAAATATAVVVYIQQIKQPVQLKSLLIILINVSKNGTDVNCKHYWPFLQIQWISYKKVEYFTVSFISQVQILFIGTQSAVIALSRCLTPKFQRKPVSSYM